MGEPAARVVDNEKCPVHRAEPIIPPCHPPTLANGKAMARVTDQTQCKPRDYIVTGSATVQIGGKAAARVSDKTMHGGTIVEGSGNVLIGGSATGSTLGNPEAGLDAFKTAATGRTSGRTQQSYENCGIESSRQVINQATGSAISEDKLLDTAMDKGWAQREATRGESGGTTAEGMHSLLDNQGVSSSLQPQTMANIQQAVAEHRGVITAHNAGTLWNTTDEGGHAILVTGAQYDPNGKLASIIINDTGTGEGMHLVPADRYERSLLNGFSATITDHPIWP
jgi:uncharacterized Zn-binding protein involved in type VI secretion